MPKRSRACLLWIFFLLLGIQTTRSQTTGVTSQSGFVIEPDGSSSLGTATLQSGSDIRFGSSAPNYTIGEGHDILLGRSLGPDEAKLRVALKAPESLTRSQLAGDWDYYEYRINEALLFTLSTSANAVTLQSGGEFLLDGSAIGSFEINSNQHVSVTVDGNTIDYAVNASLDLMVSTSSELGFPTLRILVRPESGGTASQMAGSWNVGSFSVGSGDPPDRWYDGDTLTAASNGTASIGGESLTWSPDGNGKIAISDSEGSTTLSVNQSRSLLAYTETVGESPEFDNQGALILRAATSPSIAALSGSWTLLTFEFVDAPELSIVETYHEDGTTLASRERYTDGQLNGSPAREAWDENGNPTLTENYSGGVRTYSLRTEYNGELLSSIIKTTYDGETITSEESTYYHPDGVTISGHTIDTLTDEGRRIISEVFGATGNQTSRDETLDGILDGVNAQWKSNGDPTSRLVYRVGIKTAETYWSYHTNGNLFHESEKAYAGGNTFQTNKSYLDDGNPTVVQRFFNGNKHGAQLEYHQGILHKETNYRYGTLQGPSRRWFPGTSQLEVETFYENGKKDGPDRIWYEDGQIAVSSEYLSGVLHGTYNFYQKNGDPGETSIWVHGEWLEFTQWLYDIPTGELTSRSYYKTFAGDLDSGDVPDIGLEESWDENGDPSGYQEYERGKLHGHALSWEQNILVSDEYYQNGLRHGRVKQFSFEFGGELETDGYYINGKLHGLSLYYDPESGTLLERSNYEVDRLHGLQERFYLEDGTLAYEGNYEHGLRDGLHTTWSKEKEDKGFPTRLAKKATYKEDILHGAWRSYYPDGAETLESEGEYKDGLMDGEWSYYDEDGLLTEKSNYQAGFRHGISEYYDDEENLTKRERHTDGHLDGLQARFITNNGVTTTEYDLGEEIGPRQVYYNDTLFRFSPLKDGLIDGQVLDYYANGAIQSKTDYVSGLRHGEGVTYWENGRKKSQGQYYGNKLQGTYTAWQETGIRSFTGAYNQDQPCGTHTVYDANGDFEDSTNYGACPPPPEPEFPVARFLSGTVSSGGADIPNARVQLHDPIANKTYETTSKGDGRYFLPIPDDSDGNTVFILTIYHENYKITEAEEVTISFDGGVQTKSKTLGEYAKPTLSLGAPSVAGSHFFQDISLTVNTPIEVDWNGDPEGSVIWKRGNIEDSIGARLTIDPGLDYDDDTGLGQLVAKSVGTRSSSPLPIPGFTIYPQPEWAKTLGTWTVVPPNVLGKPGTYLINSVWPKEPFSLGFDEESLTPVGYALWQEIPLFGEGDLGLYDVQFRAKLAAYTNRGGKVEFGGQGEVRGGGFTLRVEADGEGDLIWGKTLELSRASVLLRGRFTASQDIKPSKLFPFLTPLKTVPGIGSTIRKIDRKVKLNITAGGGVGGRFPIDTTNGDLLFAPSEIELNGLSKLAMSTSTKNHFDIDVSGQTEVKALWDLKGRDGYFKNFNVKNSGSIKINIWGLVYEDDFSKDFSLLETPPSDPPIIQSIRDALVRPDFIQYGRYAEFQPDRTTVLSIQPQADEHPPELLINNVYPSANPVVVEQNGTLAIAYIHFDPDRPEGQSQRLYITMDTGSGFETPAPIHSQARADFHPQLAFLHDGRLIAAWETSQLDQVATTLEERVSGLEIAWALYDHNSGSWTDPILLSNNNHLDHSPRLATSTQGPLLLWQSNANNEPIPSNDTPDQIQIARWTGSTFEAPSVFPFDVISADYTSLAYDGTNAVFTWIHDEDGDPETIDDSELYWSKFNGTQWAAPFRVSYDNVPDSNPNVFCLENNAFELVWTKGIHLVRMADFTNHTHQIIRQGDPKSPPLSFDVDCDSQGNIAVIWTDFDEEKSDLRYALLDSVSNIWSDELLLTDNAATEKRPTFSLNEQSQLIATYLSQEPDCEEHDLHWIERELGTDLFVESITTEPIAYSPGQYTISATLQNLGGLGATNVSVQFYLGDPDAGGMLLDESSINLNGGAQSVVAIETTNVPLDSNDPIYVRLDAGNTISELDEENNTSASDLNPSDLAASYLTWDRSVSDETTLTLSGTVTNNGAKDQASIPVAITDESGVIYSTTLATLAPGESASVSTTIDTPAGSEHRFTLSVDPDNTLDEPDRSDNEFPLIVTLNQLKDNDGDGMENAWEELNFGTLDRDGRGDFDGDGLTDTFEFITQNDPLDPKSKFPFTIEPHPTDDSKVLIQFPSLQGRVYRIQRSSDLSTWTNESFHLGTGEIINVATEATDPSNGFRVQIGLQ